MTFAQKKVAVTEPSNLDTGYPAHPEAEAHTRKARFMLMELFQQLYSLGWNIFIPRFYDSLKIRSFGSGGAVKLATG